MTLVEQIRKLVESGTVDPSEIANKISIDDDAAWQEIVDRFLREYVRHVLGAIRRDASSNAPASSNRPRSIDLRLLPTPVAGGWRAFGACTVEDILEVAAAYEQRAEENASYARRYHSVADAMRKHDAAVVSDLPAQILEEAFNG